MNIIKKLILVLLAFFSLSLFIHKDHPSGEGSDSSDDSLDSLISPPSSPRIGDDIPKKSSWFQWMSRFFSKAPFHDELRKPSSKGLEDILGQCITSSYETDNSVFEINIDLYSEALETDSDSAMPDLVYDNRIDLDFSQDSDLLVKSDSSLESEFSMESEFSVESCFSVNNLDHQPYATEYDVAMSMLHHELSGLPCHEILITDNVSHSINYELFLSM
jgi:hypothetical protein